MRKQILSALFLTTFLVLSFGLVSACGYHDHDNCKVEETIVEGRVYFAETNKSAGDADVTVTCNHDGTDYTKTADTYKQGILKGTYFVLFSQSKCAAGDTVTVTAQKDGQVGSATDTVRDWITKKCKDIDLALINVPLVPEFGIVIGTATLLSAVAIFFVVRRK